MQRIASRIDAVTVYRSGALVSRVAAIEAVGGELPRAVQIMDLPLSLEDGSLRVRVFNDYSGIYLLHCHNLEHEDDGMMINIQSDAPTNLEDEESSAGYF